jgi:hypothetical protein
MEQFTISLNWVHQYFATSRILALPDLNVPTFTSLRNASTFKKQYDKKSHPHPQASYSSADLSTGEKSTTDLVDFRKNLATSPRH